MLLLVVALALVPACGMELAAKNLVLSHGVGREMVAIVAVGARGEVGVMVVIGDEEFGRASTGTGDGIDANDVIGW
jgi:hypothetical protein